MGSFEGRGSYSKLSSSPWHCRKRCALFKPAKFCARLENQAVLFFET